MKTIYLDSDFMCHLENAQGRTEVKTDVFDGTIDEAIPYYRYIPYGQWWQDPQKGIIISGTFIQAIDSTAIDRIVQQALIADMQNALAILGVTE